MTSLLSFLVTCNHTTNDWCRVSDFHFLCCLFLISAGISSDHGGELGRQLEEANWRFLFSDLYNKGKFFLWQCKSNR